MLGIALVGSALVRNVGMRIIQHMKLWKYSALGNDYLVAHDAWPAQPDMGGAVRRICDRHHGVGADGILVRIPGVEGKSFALRIFNPDGTEAEKSGNGLRIFARYLWDTQCVASERFTVTTLGGDVECRVHPGGNMITCEMGRVRFDSQVIPVAGPPREVLCEKMTVNGREIEFSAATIGNPHCVLLRDRVSEADTRALGPLIENEARFPRRTNVQFVQVLDRRTIRMEIWERGAGYTLASGSSSCAAAAVVCRLGLCDRSVTVHMPGGPLAIEIDNGFEVRMTGPVVKVFECEVENHLVAGGVDDSAQVAGRPR